MEFLHASDDPHAPIDSVRVNWFYRPKDIGRRVQDTRLVFASMHSDTCPLISIRGKCSIQHVSNIDNLEQHRKQKNSFWFDKLYDRYMQRHYEVVPTHKVVNVPQRVKEVLDTRWKFVLIEVGRSKDLTNPSKRCIRCEQFADIKDSVDCAVCKNTYHMRCVRPPLLKKPARGFAWACAACSRKQELRLEARNTPTLSESAQTPDDEIMDEDDDDHLAAAQETRDSSAAPEEHPPPTAAQLAQAELWPWRYLGVHSRVEDALDYDDRIYPRASSRLGPRHQANVNIWHGRPVEFVKPAEGKKKYQKSAGSKKDGKASKESLAAAEAEREIRQKRPKWVLDEPYGYISRGQDEPVEIKGRKDPEHTAQLTFKMPDPSLFSERGLDEPVKPADSEKLVNDYMIEVKKLARLYDVEAVSVDFLTKAVEKLQVHNYDIEKALTAMRSLSKRNDLKLPDLKPDEVKRFEDGVAKYGSELHLVARHVGTVKESRIVRFYYMWKKSDRGRQIWGNYEGRRSKKDSRRADKSAEGKVDDVADDVDDSAYDVGKANSKKRGFECKFCQTRHSRIWRRAPGTSPGQLVPPDSSPKGSKDKSSWLVLALCGKCAYLWRRYAIQYENIEEISKKIAASGGRAAKRKIDEELLSIHYEAHFEAGDPISLQTANEIHKAGMEVPSSIVQYDEPPKKKNKGDKDAYGVATPDEVPEKKKPAEKVPEAPLEPEPPRIKIHPCAVCHVIEVPGQRLLKCRDCRIHVHGACYGVGPASNTSPWFCDMCRNDHNLQVSTIYECTLCPVTYTHQELMEPLKVSHKKKTDREREKERVEREILIEASRKWREQQEAAGRPVNPREALKRTAWNNWVHIICAIWTPEMKFANAELLDDAEGIGFIPPSRYHNICKVCKSVGSPPKPTHHCHLPGCDATFHIGCAHQANYIFGFDVTPVKGSRRDSVQVIKLRDEIGHAVPGIWCPNHAPPSYVHNMVELTEGDVTALQLYARTYKQVDTTLTGTERRSHQFQLSKAPAVQPPQRSNTFINGERSTRRGHTSRSISPSDADDRMDVDGASDDFGADQKAAQKKCCACNIDVSPVWHMFRPSDDDASESEPPRVNGVSDPYTMNGVLKVEPREHVGINGYISTTPLWRCNKCHIRGEKPTPPPAQPRMPPPAAPPAAPELPPEPPAPEPPVYAPPASYPFVRTPLDGAHSPHSHPPNAVSHQSPWAPRAPQWTPPVLRENGNWYGPAPPPPSSSYANEPPAMWAPHHDRSGSQIPFAAPPPPSSGPLQQSPSTPGAYSIPQQPPMAARGPAPPPLQAPSGSRPNEMLPPSSPRANFDYQPSGPGLGIGGPRHYPEPSRPPVSNHVSAFSQGPPPPSPYWQGPVPPSPVAASPSHSAPHLTHIAQQADQVGSSQHSRQPSTESMPGPGHGFHSVSHYPSPTIASANRPPRRPTTPHEGKVDEGAIREPNGASTSPSLRNLLH
jgi:hypothetical protein